MLDSECYIFISGRFPLHMDHNQALTIVVYMKVVICFYLAQVSGTGVRERIHILVADRLCFVILRVSLDLAPRHLLNVALVVR